MALAIELKDLQFTYNSTGRSVLNIPQFEVETGDRVFLFGPSGSGKTTLLGLLGGILPASKGHVRILGSDLSSMSSAKRDAFRGRHVGYIFQMFNLIPYLTVGENIMLSRWIQGGKNSEARAKDLSSRLGIEAKFDDPITHLSVGQQQRVAAARALFCQPEVVIADEPTSALDADHREIFLKLLFEVCDHSKATLIFVSHDHSLKTYFNRSVSLPSLLRKEPFSRADE